MVTDGSKIAFQSNRTGLFQIYVMNADGTSQTRVSNNAFDDEFPAWSPDGKRIAFASTRDGNQEIYVMDADGSNQTRITNNPASDAFPGWSPDGTKIAFETNRDGNFQIYTMNSDGSNQTRLTNNPYATDENPTWAAVVSATPTPTPTPTPTVTPTPTPSTSPSPTPTPVGPELIEFGLSPLQGVYPTGSSPRSVAVGDLNGDGKQDLVVANYGSNDVSVLLGADNARFQPAVNYPAGSSPTAVAIGDFNRDGKPELVVTNNSGGTVSVLLGNGDGSFQMPASYSVGSSPSSVAVGDFDRDGKLDLAVTNRGTNTVSVLLGTGTGSFQQAVNYSTGLIPRFVAIGDFNNDGAQDLVVAYSFSPSSNNSGVSILLGIGTGAFKPALNYYVNGGPQSVAVADFDGDGNQDLAIAVAGVNGVRVWFGTGTGNFSRGIFVVTAPSSIVGTSSVAVADFNRDGKLDIAATTFAGTVELLLGDSAGLHPAVSYGYSSANSVGDLTPKSVAFGSFNGHLGVAATDHLNNSVAVLLGLGTGFATVGEGAGHVDIPVIRFGVISGAATVTVDVVTSDQAGSQNCNVRNGYASARCDYEARSATVSFAPGEFVKIISIPIIDDSYSEGPETFNVSLTNPVGALLATTTTAAITIIDNDAADGPNPIDTTSFFVRLQYLDFLNREPDTNGLAFWTNNINGCSPQPSCIDVQRINTSAAFFLSIEFQQTGYLVERMYRAAYGDATGSSFIGGTHQLSVPIVRFNEFLSDSQRIGQGVVVGQTGWETALENNKQAFASEFVQRSRFGAAYATTMTPAQFVDKLFLNAGFTPSSTDRNAAIAEFGSATNTNDIAARGRALRRVAENSTFVTNEFNRAFVLMEYFGYLRRNPNDPPEATLDYTGYDFWLNKLNFFNGNYIQAEMVKAFITSGEYRQRFGP